MNLLIAVAAYIAFIACVVAILRETKARHRTEREADSRATGHHNQHRRTR